MRPAPTGGTLAVGPVDSHTGTSTGVTPPAAGGAARTGLPAGGALVLGLIFGAVAFVLFALSWNAESAGFLSDDAVYLLMADRFSPFHAAGQQLSAYVMRQSLFPPFYPLVLALLGGGSTSLLAAHVVTTASLVLALAAYGLWIHGQLRDRAAAMALVCLFALAPGTLLQNLEILSESLYLLLSLAALWLAARAPARPALYGLAALCVGLATITRTAGLSLLVAWLIWSFARRISGRWKWAAVAAAPSVLWLLYKKAAVGSSGGGYASLWGGLLDHVRADPAYLISYVSGQAQACWAALSAILDLQPSRVTHAVLAVTLAAGAFGWLRRLRDVQLDALYLVIAAGMVFLYPFPGYFGRLLLPLFPLALFHAYGGVLELTGRWRVRGRPPVAYAWLAAVLLALLPSLGFLASRFALPVEPDLANFRHTRYWFRMQDPAQVTADVRFRHNLIAALTDAGALVPEADCVFGVNTAIAMLYTHRIVQQPPAPSLDDAAFERSAQRCRYFLLMPISGQIDNQAVGGYYPYERLPADKVEQVRSWGSADPSAPTAVLLRVNR